MASSAVSPSTSGVIGWKKPRSNLRKVIRPRNTYFLQNKSSSELLDCVEKPADCEAELRSMQDMMTKLKIEKERVEGELKAKKLELEGKNREQKKLLQEIKKLQCFNEMSPAAQNLAIGNKLAMKEQRRKRGSTQYKRPSPPFILWCKDEWKEVKKEKSVLDPKEITNMMVAKWKCISTAEKMQYDAKYKAQKEAFLAMVDEEKREGEAAKLLEREQKQESAIEYIEQYFQFKESKKRSKERRQKKRNDTDGNKPRRPGSAFILFSKEERKTIMAEGLGISHYAVTSSIAAKWKQLEVEEKKMWYDMAAQAMKAYKIDIEEYYKKAQTTTVDNESPHLGS